MTPFEVVLQRLYKLEGFESNDKNDPGGETYKGISRTYNPDWCGWQYVDAKDYAKADICVRDFYKSLWLKLNCDKLDNFEIAFFVFQIAVNVGTTTAVKIAQKVAGVEPDGVLGKATVNAINSMFPDKFLTIMKGEVACFYIKLADSKPQLKIYLYGWLSKRVFKEGA